MNDKYFVFARFKARGSNTFENFECYCNASSLEKALQIAKVRYNTELGRTPNAFVETGSFKVYIKNRKDWFLVKNAVTTTENPKRVYDSAWSIMQKIYNKKREDSIWKNT